MTAKTRTIIALSIIPQVLLVKSLTFFPGFVERFYSTGLYVWISRSMRYVFGWIPFSAGDLIYTLAGIYVIRWLAVNRKHILKKPLLFFRDLLMVISMLYLGFHLLWGFNYYRKPLHETIGLGKEYTTEELIATIDILTELSNETHSGLVLHDSVKVSVPYSKKELLEKSSDGYLRLRQDHPSLNPAPASIKRSIYSLPLTYMGFSGYLNPFTNEAQIDGLIPLHKYPVTACHEQAHQAGYAAENEANFIGFLAAKENEDPYFKYSAYIFALKHCLYELARRDRDLFDFKIEAVNLGIRKNYEEEQQFWSSYQNPFEPIFKETFNTFLKANSQADGIKSYSYVVALLVNYYK